MFSFVQHKAYFIMLQEPLKWMTLNQCPKNQPCMETSASIKEKEVLFTIRMTYSMDQWIPWQLGNHFLPSCFGFRKVLKSEIVCQDILINDAK